MCRGYISISRAVTKIGITIGHIISSSDFRRISQDKISCIHGLMKLCDCSKNLGPLTDTLTNTSQRDTQPEWTEYYITYIYNIFCGA